MTNSAKKYVKERDAMLMKCSVAELTKFVNNHKDAYTKEYVTAFNEAPDAVKEITLHKMIVNVVSLPEKLRQNSAIWLVSHGYDLNVW